MVSGLAENDSVAETGPWTEPGAWNIQVCRAWDRVATESDTKSSQTAEIWVYAIQTDY